MRKILQLCKANSEIVVRPVKLVDRKSNSHYFKKRWKKMKFPRFIFKRNVVTQSNSTSVKLHPIFISKIIFLRTAKVNSAENFWRTSFYATEKRNKYLSLDVKNFHGEKNFDVWLTPLLPNFFFLVWCYLLNFHFLIDHV